MVAIEALVNAQVFIGFVDINGRYMLGCLGLACRNCDLDRDLTDSSKVRYSMFIEMP